MNPLNLTVGFARDLYKKTGLRPMSRWYAKTDDDGHGCACLIGAMVINELTDREKKLALGVKGFSFNGKAAKLFNLSTPELYAITHGFDTGFEDDQNYNFDCIVDGGYLEGYERDFGELRKLFTASKRIGKALRKDCLLGTK